MSEHEAIVQLKRGDIGGLDVLVRRYQVQAVRAAYLITHDRHLAEDIVQSAFLRVYEHIDRFDLSRPFRPWFFRIVVNAAIKAVARHKRHVSIEHLDDRELISSFLSSPAASYGNDDFQEQAERNQFIQEALQELSPRQRAAICYRYYLEFSELEMAEVLGCPPGTVKSRLNQARTNLRRLLRWWISDDRDSARKEIY